MTTRIRLTRISGLLAALLMMLTIAAASAQAQARKIVVLPFELVDSSDGAIPLPDREERLASITALLKEELTREKLYEVVQSDEITALIKQQQARYDLRTCNGCDQDIAKLAGTDRVMVAWVQMVSNLILNVNIEVRDAATSQPLLNKSADMRGNQFSNWKRAVKYIVRSMVEKDQGGR